MRFLVGRGHSVSRAREVGLADEPDSLLVEYALVNDLVIVTFDAGLRPAAMRRGCRCLHIHPRESTARKRLQDAYDEVVSLLHHGHRLVTIRGTGEVTA